MTDKEKKDNRILVGVILGSDSDEEKARPLKDVFEELDLPFGSDVGSAHRTPVRVTTLTRQFIARGAEVIVAFAGAAAALGGKISAETLKPVIAVPIASTPLNGVDALYSTVQMPPGIPLGCMPVNGAANAALFAIAILATKSEGMTAKLETYREKLAAKVEKG